jgi:hypothetical protein
MKNELILSFCIWGFNDISPNGITKSLDITPTKVFIKCKKKNPKSPVLAAENGWIMESTLDKYSSFDQQMTSLLDIIESKIELFEPLCTKYYCEFSCAIFIYNDEESAPSVHLDTRYHSLARKLNFEFDIDLYCLQNE